jgi:hypothetical protein
MIRCEKSRQFPSWANYRIGGHSDFIAPKRGDVSKSIALWGAGVTVLFRYSGLDLLVMGALRRKLDGHGIGGRWL